MRRTLWGDEPKREHKLHIFGGFTFAEVRRHRADMCVVVAQPHGPGQLDVDPAQGPRRAPVVGAHRHRARRPGAGGPQGGGTALAAAFPAPLPGLVAATPPESVQRWVLRDRTPLKQWSKGRITLVRRRRARHLAVRGLRRRDVHRGRLLLRASAARRRAHRPRRRAAALQSYEDPRKPHTAKQVQMARMLGKIFHHAPAPLRPMRDFVFDHTPFLQKMAGDSNPREINQQLALIED